MLRLKSIRSGGNLLQKQGFYLKKVFESFYIKIETTKRSLFVLVHNWNVFFSSRFIAVYYLMACIS